MHLNTFGFISLGLIGGSIAMSIKNILPNSKIIAYARRQETLDTALAAGTIDKGITVIDDSFITVILFSYVHPSLPIIDF